LGRYATIELKWNDSRRSLQIGTVMGQYEGMPERRTFIVQTPWGDKQVEYTGKKMTVKM
jgi:hypothetical protein